MKEFDIAIGKTNYIDGLQISINRTRRKVSPSGTAIHEAKHVVAARHNGTGIRMATIHPGVGYSGMTELSRPDAVAALAPHATGEGGTSWDVQIAEDIGSAGAAGAARAIINSNMEEVFAVAEALEEQKTITGTGVEKAISDMDKEDVSISIVDVAGNFKELSQTVTKGEILMIPGEWVTLPKAA